MTGWLCWQSEANPSLPAKVGNAGRFRQIAGKAATHPCRKSPHLNALDLLLPNPVSRENLVHSREANTADKVLGTRRGSFFLSRPWCGCSDMTEVPVFDKAGAVPLVPADNSSAAATHLRPSRLHVHLWHGENMPFHGLAVAPIQFRL